MRSSKHGRTPASHPIERILRRACEWLLTGESCRTSVTRASTRKGIATINLDDAEDGIRELERAARLGLSGAMITRISSRRPALRPTRVRPVLGRRRARPALKSAHRDAPPGQDPRRRSRNIARRQQPRDKGVLSGAIDVRHDLLRYLRASS